MTNDKEQLETKAYYTNTLNVSSCMDKLKEVRQEIINNW